jgi:Family of unknown function (DUF5677)
MSATEIDPSGDSRNKGLIALSKNQELYVLLDQEVIKRMPNLGRQQGYREAIQIVLHRSFQYLYSLTKLDQPGDFQAVKSISRILFELRLDIKTLETDTNLYKKFLAYNYLDRMRGAIRISDYVAKNPSTNSDSRYRTALKTASEAENIRRCEELIREHYGKTVDIAARKLKGYPDTWSGLKLRDRIDNAYRKEKGITSTPDLDAGFYEHYVVEYNAASWHVHGGGVGVFQKNLDDLITLWKNGHEYSRSHMINIGYVACKELGLFQDSPELKEKLAAFGLTSER